MRTSSCAHSRHFVTPRRESNLHFILRRDVSYPLNDEEYSINTTHKLLTAPTVTTSRPVVSPLYYRGPLPALSSSKGTTRSIQLSPQTKCSLRSISPPLTP